LPGALKHWVLGRLGLQNTINPMWEGLAPIAVCQPDMYRLTLRHRGQAQAANDRDEAQRKRPAQPLHFA